MKGNLASRPLDFYFLLNLGPWRIWGTEEAAALMAASAALVAMGGLDRALRARRRGQGR